MPFLLGWFGLHEERRVIAAVQDHLAQVRATVELLPEVLAAALADDRQAVAEAHARLFAAEHRADELRRQILEQIATDAWTAGGDDLAHLVERLDDVADFAHGASRLLALCKGRLPASLADDLLAFARLLATVVQHLARAVLCLYQGDVLGSLAGCTDVERAEEEADQRKAALLERVLDMDLPPTPLLLLHDLIEAMENTADRAEDSADLVRVVAVKHRR